MLLHLSDSVHQFSLLLENATMFFLKEPFLVLYRLTLGTVGTVVAMLNTGDIGWRAAYGSYDIAYLLAN